MSAAAGRRGARGAARPGAESARGAQARAQHAASARVADAGERPLTPGPVAPGALYQARSRGAGPFPDPCSALGTESHFLLVKEFLSE